MGDEPVLPPVTPDRDLPASPDDALNDEQRESLRRDLIRLAKLRRDVEIESGALRLA
jgi:hypothetical protein